MGQSLQVRKAAGALGAFIEGASLQEYAMQDELFGQLVDLVLEYEVVFLPGQADAAPDVFQSFARRFGPVLAHPAYATVDTAPDVQILESTVDNPSKIEMWHSDMTFSATPPTFTILHGQIIPEVGGDTLWASTTAAYDALSAPMRTMLDGLVAVHDFRHGFQESLAEPGGIERLAAAIADNPPVSHPLVRTHPVTGRKALFVNRLFTSRIEGMSNLESSELLNFLFQHITTPEFTVRLNWQPGLVAIWDNRSTQHKPVNDFFPAHRKLHRITICGDRPV